MKANATDPLTSLRRQMRQLAGAWLALVLLMSLSLGVAYLHLGAFTWMAGIGIALVKIAVIGRWFMQLQRASPWSRLAGAIALALITLLAALGFFEAFTRDDASARWQVPQQLPAVRPAPSR
jgi:caa(3)-type oxidase subunit IV